MVKVYRYDERVFQVGDVIKPDLGKKVELTEKNKAVEKCISELNPGVASIRCLALYTWANRRIIDNTMHARERGVAVLQNKNFYVLNINPDDILFQGDLVYHTLARENLDNKSLCREYLNKFIQGEIYNDAVQKEILVTKAQVLSVLDDK